MTNLDRLIKKHRELDLEIKRIQSSRKLELMDDRELAHLHLLKKRKLALRDQIASIEEAQQELILA